MTNLKVRMLGHALVGFCLILSADSGLLFGQTTGRHPARKTSASFALVSAKATGSQRYSSQQIVAATGLQPGQKVSEEDFKRASQLLGETGAFSNVTYSFEYSGEGAKLDLQVSDSGQFVPTYFDNFVWFPEQELQDNLRARVPLFQGKLPLDGKLADQVSDALQTLLIEHGVQGRVDYLRAGPDNGPVESFHFSVSGQSIRIRNTDFLGAGAEQLPLLQKAGTKLSGQDYVLSTLRTHAEKNFLPVYLALGYLKASFSDPAAKVVQQSEQQSEVDIAFTVDAGKQYNATEIKLSGAKAIPAAQLRELIHQQTGKPANAVQLARDLEAIKKLYGSRGYMAVAIQLTPTLDDAASTVSYQIQVQEGDVFHMGDLDIQDLSVHDTREVTARWALNKGDTYDSGYPKRFVDEILKDVLKTGEYNISIRESPEPDDKSVDVSVRFERKANDL